MKKPSMREPRGKRGKASTKKSAKIRRRRSAATAVNKGTTLLQTDRGTQLVWGGNQPRPQKV
jgi:hypothetical protein